MSLSFPPFSDSAAGAAERQRATEDAFASSFEAARATLASRLTMCTSVSANEKPLIQRLCEAILQGDLQAVQRAMVDLGHCGSRKNAIVDLIIRELRAPGVTIPPLQLARWRFDDAEDLHEVAVLSLHLVNAHRILAVATDERFGAHVYCRDGGTTNEVNEQPRILLKQIGRVICSGITSTPPPFYKY